MAILREALKHANEPNPQPDRCPTCRMPVVTCDEQGCNLCGDCGSPEADHIPNISEAGPICPGQLEDLDIFIESEEEEG